jgi:hypothetical protein
MIKILVEMTDLPKNELVQMYEAWERNRDWRDDKIALLKEEVEMYRGRADELRIIVWMGGMFAAILLFFAYGFFLTGHLEFKSALEFRLVWVEREWWGGRIEYPVQWFNKPPYGSETTGWHVAILKRGEVVGWRSAFGLWDDPYNPDDP